MEEHLQECPDCRQVRARMQAAVSAVQSLSVDDPAAGFWPRLKARVPQSPKRRWAWLPTFPVLRRLGVALPMAAAAAAAVGLIFWHGPTQEPQSTSPTNLYVLQCVERHATYGGSQSVGEDVILIDNGTESY